MMSNSGQGHNPNNQKNQQPNQSKTVSKNAKRRQAKKRQAAGAGQETVTAIPTSSSTPAPPSQAGSVNPNSTHQAPDMLQQAQSLTFSALDELPSIDNVAEQQPSQLPVGNTKEDSLPTGSDVSPTAIGKDNTQLAQIVSHIPLDDDKPLRKVTPEVVGQLLTNHFTILPTELKMLHCYNFEDKIRKTPKENDTATTEAANQASSGLSQRVRRRIFRLLLDEIRSIAEGENLAIATNYNNQVISCVPIKIAHEGESTPTSLEEDDTFTVKYYDEDQSPNDSNLTEFVLTVASETKVDVQNVLQHLRSNRKVPNQYFDSLQQAEATVNVAVNALNVVISDRANESTFRFYDRLQEPRVTNINSNKFYQFQPRPIPLPDAPGRIQLNEVNKASPNEKPEFPLAIPEKENGGGLLALLGFFRSVRAPLTHGFLLNMNAITGCFYQPLRLDKLIGEFQKCNSNIDDLHHFIAGLRVQTKHMINNEHLRKRAAEAGRQNRERYFTISGLAREAPRQPGKIIFNQGQPTETSVLTYWTDVLHEQIASNEWMICAGNPKKPLYYPASRLEVLPGQPYKKKIVSMVEQACRRPLVNLGLIGEQGRNVFQMLQQNNVEWVQNWGLQVGPHFEQVNVCKLKSPEVQYRHKEDPDPVLFTGSKLVKWNLFQRRFIRSFEGKFTWAVLSIYGGDFRCTSEHDYTTFCQNLAGSLRDAGITEGKRYSPPDGKDLLRLSSNPIDEIQARLEYIKKKWGVSILIVLLPGKSAENYQAVKRTADMNSLPTICVAAYRTGKIQTSSAFTANLVMKANLKLSGDTLNHTTTSLFAREDSKRPPVLTMKTMILGLDVTHPPRAGAMKKAPSVAAMVANRDHECGQWPAVWALNERDPKTDKIREQVIDIGSMVRTHLQRWKARHNNEWPTRIVLYRDGLSEGQFAMCRQEEITKIKDMLRKCATFDKVDCPPLLVVCTIKRHHTRFAPGENQTSTMLDTKNNPVHGSVFYDKVTYGEGRDFFLVSHTTLQGTTRAIHYVVLHNEIDGISLEDIANSTYQLCFTWGRSLTSVGLVPPSYYADVACDRGRCYLQNVYQGWTGENNPTWNWRDHEDISNVRLPPDMEDIMFYI